MGRGNIFEKAQRIGTDCRGSWEQWEEYDGVILHVGSYSILRLFFCQFSFGIVYLYLRGAFSWTGIV